MPVYLRARLAGANPVATNGAGMNNQSQPPIWARAEIDSPCVNVCVIHPREGICAGCYRTLEEIGAWSQMTPETRRGIMADLPARAGLLKKRRGGREAPMRNEN